MGASASLYSQDSISKRSEGGTSRNSNNSNKNSSSKRSASHPSETAHGTPESSSRRSRSQPSNTASTTAVEDRYSFLSPFREFIAAAEPNAKTDAKAAANPLSPPPADHDSPRPGITNVYADDDILESCEKIWAQYQSETQLQEKEKEKEVVELAVDGSSTRRAQPSRETSASTRSLFNSSLLASFLKDGVVEADPSDTENNNEKEKEKDPKHLEVEDENEVERKRRKRVVSFVM